MKASGLRCCRSKYHGSNVDLEAVTISSESPSASEVSALRSHSWQAIARTIATNLPQTKCGWPHDQPPLLVFLRKSGEPSRTRTCDPLVKRAVKPVPSSHGSLDLLTFYTGCSRFGVHLVIASHTCLSVFTSQICHKNEQSTRALCPLAQSTRELLSRLGRRALIEVSTTDSESIRTHLT
jgi:hypothetical protein